MKPPKILLIKNRIIINKIKTLYKYNIKLLKCEKWKCENVKMIATHDCSFNFHILIIPQ